ncbi:hypothetical protein [Deinococcus alpinitundrae]|uniref:hypothetical protein n=1 Tax=Deinococcus alpinitundrae TaxID=468913 RepID=UPI00137A053F|nr:hypothetical protein [Deinococcus alpinitundrae]
MLLLYTQWGFLTWLDASGNTERLLDRVASVLPEAWNNHKHDQATRRTAVSP